MKKHVAAGPGADGRHERHGTHEQPQRSRRRVRSRGVLAGLTHGDVARYGFGLLLALAALWVILFEDGRNENWAYTTLGALVTAFVNRRVP